MCKKFALIGWNIQNSASNFIHSKIFQHFNLHKTHCYELININPLNFDTYFKENISAFAGVNITTPYKIKTFNKLKSNSKFAKYFGCVNTIKKLKDGTLKGFCTDHIGLLHSLKKLNKSNFKNILIIGFGGAGQMSAQCIKNRCENLFIAVKQNNLLHSTTQATKIFLKSNTNCKIHFIQNDNLPYINFDLIINATTFTNLKNQQTPVNLNAILNCSCVFDLNYFPTASPILQQAKKKNALTLNGIDMLVSQALASQTIWNNLHFSKQFTSSLIKQTKFFLKQRERTKT